MKKNKGLDITRAIAILIILIYHIYVLLGSPLKELYPFLNSILALCGEVGVTLFFVISGFGIYHSIENTVVSEGKIDFKEFIKKRIKKLLPQYLLCLLILICITGAVANINANQLISHLFLFHNLFPDTHGNINGVLWTMGVIFQFYLISHILYKAIQKNKWLTYIGSVILVILLKVLFYRFIVFPNNYDSVYYFIYGRQIFTALDNFVIGMLVAKITKEHDFNISKVKSWFLLIALIFATLIFVNFSYSKVIYGVENFSYIFHSLLAIIMAAFVFLLTTYKFGNSIISKIMCFISKYEYGIYLWHLIIIQNFISYFPNFQMLQLRYKFIILFSISIIFGYIASELMDKLNLSELFLTIKSHINKIVNIFIFLLLLMITPNFVSYINRIIINIQNIKSNNIIQNDNLSSLIDNINETIKSNNKYRYIYIDGIDEEGYMNFYRIRYYLSPNEAIHYNIYANILNSNDENAILQYLNSIEIDYIIIKKSDILKDILNLNTSINDDGIIFKKNNEQCKKLSDVFLPIEDGEVQ